MFRLTTLSRGGGCGCKIAPQVLEEIIAGQGIASPDASLLIGNNTLDDAAVYRISDSRVLVATTDFFTPIVDNPRDFGRIAASNAISDIYAMGATPSLALNILGMPVDKIPTKIVREILAGGSDICQQANIVIGGGHSIDTSDPIYGLAVIGTAHPQQIKSNSQAGVNDVLILGKPIGVGVLATALRQEKLTDEEYQTLINYTTQLNQVGQLLGVLPFVHALTDVSGFGLLGHLSEMCQGSQLSATIYTSQIPWIPAAKKYAQQGIVTGAADRNQKAYGKHIGFSDKVQDWEKGLLFDPQTSGGLLVAVAAEAANELLNLFKENGFDCVAKIGTFNTTKPTVGITVNR